MYVSSDIVHIFTSGCKLCCAVSHHNYGSAGFMVLVPWSIGPNYREDSATFLRRMVLSIVFSAVGKGHEIFLPFMGSEYPYHENVPATRSWPLPIAQTDIFRRCSLLRVETAPRCGQGASIRTIFNCCLTGWLKF